MFSAPLSRSVGDGLGVRAKYKKKRADKGSLKNETNGRSGGLEQEISKGKESDHIGRNYRQSGSFVKGLRDI
jgi:hypothetical protein